jgi:hypothetical protein
MKNRRAPAAAVTLKTQQARPMRVPGFFRAWNRSGHLDVGGLLALGTLNDLKGDLLAFFERLEAVHVDGGKMREQVVAAIVRSDKTKTLCIVEPLNSTGCHVSYFLSF